jgi:predicted porin
MKKLAIAAALAAMATTVSAQNVTVYGKMSLYQERDSVGTASALTRQSDDTSRIGFRGTEDLGKGLKAFFVLETAVSPDAPSATTLGGRASVVGLNTDLWRVAMGRDKHQVARIHDRFDPLLNSFGNTSAVIHPAYAVRMNNAIFASITPIKGVTAHYQRSESETAGIDAAQVFALDASFGPIATTVARYDNGRTGADENSTTTIGASFTVASSGTTFTGIYSDDTVNGVKDQGKTVGVRQRLGGPLTVLASYGTNDTNDTYALGADYSLSKRTFLHARYHNNDSTNNASDRKRFGIGVTHTF